MADLIKAYVSVLDKWAKWLVFVVWLAALGIGGARVGTLFGNLEDNLEPPSSSRSIVADEVFSNSNYFCYPDKAVLVATTTDGSDVRTEWVRSTFETLHNIPYSAGTVGYFQANESAPLVRDDFITPDNTAVVAYCLGYNSFVVEQWDDWLSLQHIPDNIRIYTTSTNTMDDSTSGAASSDLGRADGVSIPVSLLLLAYRVKSLPMMVIPVACLVVSILTAFAILAALSSNVSFPSFSPSLFISTSIAMSFDWCLFLLSRFREESDKGQSPVEATVNALRHSGHACVVSGICLCVSYLALVAFPVNFLSSTGKGAAITLGACLVVVMTLVPAFLVTMPSFFLLGTKACLTCRCCRRRQSGQPESEAFLPSSSPAFNKALLDGGAVGEKPNCWVRLVKAVVAHPLVVLGLVAVSLIPFAYLSTKLEITADFTQLYPSNTKAFKAWKKYDDLFDSGPAKPFALVALPVPNHPDPVLQAEILVQINNELLADIVASTPLSAMDLVGPTWVAGEPYNASTALGMLRDPNFPLFNSPEGDASRFLNDMCNHLNYDDNNNPNYFYTSLNTPFSPIGGHASSFIHTTRDLIDKHNNASIVTFYMAEGITFSVDVVEAVYSLFPYVILATGGILLVLVGLSFRSVLTAFRLVVTLGVTMVYTVGAAVLVFQDGLVPSDSAKALFWMGPVLTASLILGLGVDYDVFLMVRIAEYRNVVGLPTKDAIIAGCSHTSAIVTTAGLIMMCAFGSLMSSSQLLLIQAGFLLAFSIGVDTFLVRTLVVPAMMTIMGEGNWWPRRPPVKVDPTGAVPISDWQ